VITDQGAVAVVATGKIVAEQPAPDAGASADAAAPTDAKPAEAAPAA